PIRRLPKAPSKHSRKRWTAATARRCSSCWRRSHPPNARPPTPPRISRKRPRRCAAPPPNASANRPPDRWAHSPAPRRKLWTATVMSLFAPPPALRAAGGEIVLELVPAAHATPAAKVHRLADEPRRERAQPPEQSGRRGEEGDVDGEATDGRAQRQDRGVARR